MPLLEGESENVEMMETTATPILYIVVVRSVLEHERQIWHRMGLASPFMNVICSRLASLLHGCTSCCSTRVPTITSTISLAKALLRSLQNRIIDIGRQSNNSKIISCVPCLANQQVANGTAFEHQKALLCSRSTA
jgi:hypothetical protein